MRRRNEKLQARLLCGAAAAAVLIAAAPASAQTTTFNIAAQPLADGLNEFARQSGQPVMFTPEVTATRMTRGVADVQDPEQALNLMLADTGLTWRRSGDTFLIGKANQDPQGAGAAGGGAEVEALIVTAQKREEDIQDVPIAISAFSQEALERSQVAGGPDLMTQIPNMSFTKTNFTSYSIQIRGIGTQAISATTDPAVAVAFNNTPFIRNRFFEQEFYDVERLEVLRGPQGTLYGRNATAGVVNIISAKAKFSPEAKASVDIGNYSTRRAEGMVNIPLVEDAVAMRFAGAMTQRDGYAFNQMTGKQIDGRDLWSTRLSLRIEPTDRWSANLIWEHFEEDDDRLRSGKQLCKKDPGPATVDGIPVAIGGGVFGLSTYLSQGCLPVSLYSPEAFQTPNGFSLPFYGPTANIGNPVRGIDPYLNATQSRDLRVIESSVEPEYRAKSDIGQLQISFDISDSLTIASETSYSTDELFSLQDYNRFTTTPGAFNPGPQLAPGLLSPDGVFCDPQLGCSDRLLLVDLSTSESSQFSQEFRLSSDFSGPVNFSLGVNYLRHDAMDKYYVFINSLSMFAANQARDYVPPYVPGVSDNEECLGGPGMTGATAPIRDPNLQYGFGVAACIYIDPNPIGSLNDQGRNYFLSKNPYKLISYAGFGELYYQITPDLKLTAGLRFTVDKKQAPQVPSWLLASLAPGDYAVASVVDQKWEEPTGRLALDWKPTLSFTDETLLYASYAHGYKAGGANPPPPTLVTYGGASNVTNEIIPDRFGPEFVDAFEVGTKNALFDGAVTLNLTGFYYDYQGYQTSEIRNRSAVNSNFDAEVWGAEIEADWRPLDNLKLGFKGGYNGTRLADGSAVIDLMDRTAGNADWIVVRPFPTIPSNCIIPAYVAGAGGVIRVQSGFGTLTANGICVDAYLNNVDPITQQPYDPAITDYSTFVRSNGQVLGPAYADYIGWDPRTAPNGGQGFKKDLSGNELPNAPRYTATLTADYTVPLQDGWLVTLHGDYHYQSGSWARVINSDPYDRIKAFHTVNTAAIFTNEDAGWKIMAYVKNFFDETAITGSFLNSDDTGLTTNVFLTEPRLYGLRVTKEFTGGGWLDGLSRRTGEPYPVTLQIGGGTSRFSGDAEHYSPSWLGLYSPAFAIPFDTQDEDLDWGDTRSVKLTYAPSKEWRASAEFRFGKTNHSGRGAAYEAVPGGYQYNPIFKYTSYQQPPDNHLRVAAEDTEEHSIAEFKVGRNFGIGLGPESESHLAVGLRYAEFTSTSGLGMHGTPDWYVPDFYEPPAGVSPFSSGQTHSIYNTTLDSERHFKGFGPMLSWEMSTRLWGDNDHGHFNADWSVGGGVLFGQQTVDSEESRFAEHQAGGFLFESFESRATRTITLIHDDVIVRSRERDVTVPNLSFSLGLSYTIDRVKVSTGYTYDQFFDAIDGGFDEPKQYDRTIHGPYFKLSVGFGG